jgi:hypothetical protein
MKLKFLFITLFISALSFAQNNGTVTGTVTDGDMNNETLPFASVSVKGTTIAANTDEKGTYTLTVPAGNHTLVFNFMGYETVEAAVTVAAGETKTVNQVLKSGSVQLQDVVISKSFNRQKESALLLDQKDAVEIKQNIGAQELSRKGVTDVAGAVAKTSGVTRQEGSGNIYVRGLGDRYNSTTMNGLPIPSNNVEKKNITLDIFPTQIVEYVSIDKVYSSRLYGDYAGGNIDIVSKDYKGDGFVRVDIGSSINTNAVADDNFRLQKKPGAFGFTNIDKPSNPLNAYSFETLQLEKQNPFAGTLGISGGDSYNVGEEGKINFFATAAFGNEYLSITEGESFGDISGAGLASKRYDDYQSFNYATNTTGMANIGYRINSANKINFNTLFINTSNQQTEEYRGYAVDFAEDGNGFIRRNTYIKTNLFINQLLGEHKIGDRTKINWAVSQNTVDDDMPDRTQNKMKQTDNGYVLFSQSYPDNHRYFQSLKEDETAALASVDYKFAKTDDDYNGKLTLGYSGRFKKRDFEATQYNFRTVTSPVSHAGDLVDPENLDLFYNQENFANNFFTIATFRGGADFEGALLPQTYNGELTIHSAFAVAEYKFSPKLTAVIGLRAEDITQKTEWDTQLSGYGEDELTKMAFLPNVLLKYALNDKHNLRFAFSKTYTLPQFKETIPFVYERVTQVTFGNKDLYESDNYNLDLKWEMFPNKEELISFTAFGKYILNPINETTINSTTNDISWLNTGDTGYVIGAEAEIRKTLYAVEEENSKRLTGGLNVSYTHSEQDLDQEKVEEETTLSAAFTNKKSAFAGASDLLVNADVSFFKEWNNKMSNITATVAYNYFSDRIYSIGTLERGDLVDKAVSTLDLIVKSKFNQNLGLSLSARNLLDPRIERVQENAGGDVISQTYKKGMFFSLSLNYEF